MMIVFDFCHEKGVKAVDGFEFEMKILFLLYGSFKISIDDDVKIFEFPQKLKDTFMTYFPNGYFNAAQVENHLTQ